MDNDSVYKEIILRQAKSREALKSSKGKSSNYSETLKSNYSKGKSYMPSKSGPRAPLCVSEITESVVPEITEMT